jgi:hypothetical protein
MLDVLEVGAVIETSAAGSAVVAFADGSRFEVESDSRAVIARSGLEVDTGRIRPLEPVPAMIRLSPIAAGQDAGTAGTGRIRHDGTTETAELVLDPPTGSWVLTDDLPLAFNAVDGYTLYRVTVERGWGETVFDIKTRATELNVPGDALEPGGTYHWSAETLDPDRPRLHAGAVFFTISEEDARARDELVDQIEAASDPSLYILLAAVDHRLGLAREACQSLQAAAQAGADEAAVRELQRSLSCAGTP